MKEKTFYMCDFCHTNYKTEEEATACEETHCTINGTDEVVYHSKQKYPEKIKVKFSDGTFGWYRV